MHKIDIFFKLKLTFFIDIKLSNLIWKRKYLIKMKKKKLTVNFNQLTIIYLNLANDYSLTYKNKILNLY